MAPKLSLVVGTLDRPQLLGNLIDSIKKNTPIEWELIIADASIKYPLNTLQNALGSNIKVLSERPRLGHVKGYNRAFRACSGDWVVWLNDDAIVMPDWWRCVEVMERNKWIGMGALKFGQFMDAFLTFEYQGLPYANFGIINREFGNELGWFDEEVCYFYGGDNSLTFKVFLANKPVTPIPGRHILHVPCADEYRLENELLQAGDGAKLMAKYRTLLPRMLEVHEKFRKKEVI